MILPKSTITLRSRNINIATEAYKNNDKIGSKLAHSQERKIEDEPHRSLLFRKGFGKYSKVFITIGSYAIIFSISVILGLNSFLYRSHMVGNNQHGQYHEGKGTHAHEMDNFYVFQLCSIIVLVCGIGYALMEASQKSLEIKFYEAEKKREIWEYDNFIEGEQREMVELYCQKGMVQDDARVVVDLLSKYKELFIDIMMAEELNLLPVELLLSPMETFISTCISFIFFGMLPLIPFYLNLLSGALIIYIFMVELLLFIIGSIKTYFYTGIWWKEGLMLSLTGLFFILISNLLGSSMSNLYY